MNTKKLYELSENNNSIKIGTLRDILDYFKPDREMTENCPEEWEEWKKIEQNLSLDTLRDYIDERMNESNGIRYHNYVIEEW